MHLKKSKERIRNHIGWKYRSPFIYFFKTGFLSSLVRDSRDCKVTESINRLMIGGRLTILIFEFWQQLIIRKELLWFTWSMKPLTWQQTFLYFHATLFEHALQKKECDKPEKRRAPESSKGKLQSTFFGNSASFLLLISLIAEEQL